MTGKEEPRPDQPRPRMRSAWIRLALAGLVAGALLLAGALVLGLFVGRSSGGGGSSTSPVQFERPNTAAEVESCMYPGGTAPVDRCEVATAP